MVRDDIISLVKNIVSEDFEVFQDEVSDIDTAYFGEYQIPKEYSLFIEELLDGESYIVMQNTNTTNFVIVFQTMMLKCVDKNDYVEFMQYLESEVNKI